MTNVIGVKERIILTILTITLTLSVIYFLSIAVNDVYDVWTKPYSCSTDPICIGMVCIVIAFMVLMVVNLVIVIRDVWVGIYGKKDY